MSRWHTLTCALPACGAPFVANSSRVNRARSIEAPLYCSRVCAGRGRRLVTPPTEEEKRAAKRLYDMQYRAANLEAIKRKKATHFQAIKVRDASRHRAYRQAHRADHAAYCRQPAYKAKKQQYDQHHRAQREYGEYGDAAIVLYQLEQEIAARATKEERAAFKGTVNKAQQRRRAL